VGKHQSDKRTVIDFNWANEQLNLLKRKHIQPIIGLVHHGSGPAFTNLLDKQFPYLLADYAKQVAEQFPWVEYYTPINEPLTTARFSGLYGFWYPHQKDAHTCLTILLNQLKGVVLAMQSIRKINPDAKLVQTEDIGKTHGTKTLQYQCRFENERKWLTNDLLCGKVNEQHPLWKYMMHEGIDKAALYFFLENKCPPDIIGLNYYVTSERFIDEQLDKYPVHTHGGNGTHAYADVEAVRVKKPAGIKRLLEETWQRYQLPLAITEVHLNCTREEQLRWLHEIWDASYNISQKGIPVTAVTAWSLLGAYDWNSLLTQSNQHYEPGVFDIRYHPVRKTALANCITSIGTTGKFHHPLLKEKGWWHNNARLYASHSTPPLNSSKNNSSASQPLLIIGKNGTLARGFAAVCSNRNIKCIALSRNEINILDEASVIQAIKQYKPWAVMNTAGYVKVDDAEADAAQCFLLNTDAAALLAKVCADDAIPFVTFSSDMVFDGAKKNPYTEQDKTYPLNVYGKSKAYAEEKVIANHPAALIIRTSTFFGPWDMYNFAHKLLHNLKHQQPFAIAGDVIISPTYVPDLIHTALDLLIDEEKGIWHITNDGNISWSDLAVAFAERAGHTKNNIIIKSSAEMEWKAQRPAYSALKSERGLQLPSLHNAIDRFSLKNNQLMPASKFMFATGIENSYPVIQLPDGSFKRVDEMAKTGHYEHWKTDFQLVKETGIDYLRYGPPYYSTQTAPGKYDWTFSDEVFNALDQMQIIPIIDLCHFGVPDWIGNFQNPDFPMYFAEYAKAFAKRFPYYKLYTPVNEIFIAAMFSAQYGWWNERLQSDRAFVTALKNICKANVMAMREILSVQPEAVFIQSESSEYFHAMDPAAVPLARFLNQKRFLSLDLTYGYPINVTMYEYLLQNGMTKAEYGWFIENQVKARCVMGNDYYVTNEHLVFPTGIHRPPEKYSVIM